MWFIIRYNNGTIFLTDDKKSIKISISWKKNFIDILPHLKKVYKISITGLFENVCISNMVA